MVENATDGVEDFLETDEESDSTESTTSSDDNSVPDLIDSFYACKIA